MSTVTAFTRLGRQLKWEPKLKEVFWRLAVPMPGNSHLHGLAQETCACGCADSAAALPHACITSGSALWPLTCFPLLRNVVGAAACSGATFGLGYPPMLAGSWAASGTWLPSRPSKASIDRVGAAQRPCPAAILAGRGWLGALGPHGAAGWGGCQVLGPVTYVILPTWVCLGRVGMASLLAIRFCGLLMDALSAPNDVLIALSCMPPCHSSFP